MIRKKDRDKDVEKLSEERTDERSDIKIPQRQTGSQKCDRG